MLKDILLPLRFLTLNTLISTFIHINLHIFLWQNRYRRRHNARRQGSVQHLVPAIASISASTAGVYQLLVSITYKFMQWNYK
ncbi:MAG: hypothetical protein ACTS7E_01020 [Arsenophonus sp. NC-CH8-MAG3]